ncbi:hypothetical protein PS631_05025 [Pseudomonas fluorescens]|uniref:Uncharacterized protein n=1 Tax=Pseudomonas fluorescens TaxID=294 RepID=A0A5E6WX50_PSEFL|nr:hypothetical protein PS631_05025 [Pseudomonas fluorescens]
MLGVEGLHQLVDNVTRQLGSQVSEFVGVHFLGSGQQLVIVHVGDQGLADGVGYFQEDVAVTIRAHQLPDRQAVVERQCFENVGDVGRVQVIELALQLDQVLAVDEALHQAIVLPLLTVGQVFNNTLTLQQVNHLGQAILQAVLAFLYFDFGHRRTPLPAAEHAGEINRSDLFWQIGLRGNYWVSPWWYSTSPGGADGRNHTLQELSDCLNFWSEQSFTRLSCDNAQSHQCDGGRQTKST